MMQQSQSPNRAVRRRLTTELAKDCRNNRVNPPQGAINNERVPEITRTPNIRVTKRAGSDINAVFDRLESNFVVGEPCCSSAELVGPKPESGFQQDNSIVGSNFLSDHELIRSCRLDGWLCE